jgi:AraC family transcriptional regulator
LGSGHGEEFGADATHCFVHLPSFHVTETSSGLGWSSLFLSSQTEKPYREKKAGKPVLLVGTLDAGPMRARITIDKVRTEVRAVAGAVTLVPDMLDVAIDLAEPIRSTHLYIKRELFDEVAEGLSDINPERIDVLPRFGVFDPFLERVSQEARHALHEDPKISGLYTDHLARTVAAHLIRKHSSASTHQRFASDRLSARLAERIRDFVEARLSEEISTTDIAAAVGMSPDHLNRVFKRTTGSTLYQFVIRCRIDCAKRMLARTNIPIAVIALECGFSDQISLTRTFRKTTGTTPATYRAQSII